MSRKMLIAALVLMAFGLFIFGCELEADKEEDELPTRNYGETFKMYVDPIGPAKELDETGHQTGRRGYWFDHDHNFTGTYLYSPEYDREAFPDGGEAKLKDAFYQLSRPTAGIVALGFGDDGYANSGVPVAMTKLVPGQVHYEVPLDSMKEWVKDDNTIGYRPGKFMDDPDMLVYFNRATGEEYEAPLTGTTAERTFSFVSLGTVQANAGGKKSAEADSSDEGEDYGDVDPFRVGDADDKCKSYGDVCNKMASCNMLADGWTKLDCKQRMFSYFKHGARAGSDYVNCLKGCSGNCTKFENCKNRCVEQVLPDEYGCGGSYGPDVMDVFYVVERDGEISFVEEGANISGADRLAVFVEYADVEGNMAGGAMNVTVGLNDTVSLPFPSGIRKDSLTEGKFLGFTFESPLPEGRIDFTIALNDGELNGKYCFKEGDVDYEGYFNVTSPEDAGGGDISDVKRTFRMYEVYSPGITKYNIGTGFVDISALPKDFFVELMEFDVGIIQGYYWALTGIHNMGSMTLTDLNALIFSTPQNTRKTKYDETDDITSYAFYIDQPMTSGLFTFYGDAGWNLYPKAPYGDNDDQPFIRGDFATTEMYMPMTPFYTVDPLYTGCGYSCEHLLDFAEDTLHIKLDYFDDNWEAALESCRSDFRDEYWSCTIDCLNLAEAGLNGCEPTTDCLKNCPANPTEKKETYCQGYRDIGLKIRLNIDDAYLDNCLYTKAIYGPDHDATANCTWEEGEAEDWEPIRVGAWFNDPVPGAFVDVQWPQSDYLVSLPYGPKLSLDFIGIGAANDQIQGQMYIAAYKGAELFATGYYMPNDNNDEDWVWLLIYAYNWASPNMEGWTLGTVSGNSITAIVNIFEPVIELNFGDLRALVDGDDAWLDPDAEE